jgi:hypothetical protein
MGNATEYMQSLKRQPLSRSEVDERRLAALVREDMTTTLEGDIVERVTPRAMPLPVHKPEPATWD